jgi:hypothetical protein
VTLSTSWSRICTRLMKKMQPINFYSFARQGFLTNKMIKKTARSCWTLQFAFNYVQVFAIEKIQFVRPYPIPKHWSVKIRRDFRQNYSVKMMSVKKKCVIFTSYRCLFFKIVNFNFFSLKQLHKSSRKIQKFKQFDFLSTSVP